MLHEPASSTGKEYASREKTRLGLILFFAYAIIYFTFVFIGLNYTEIFGIKVVGGLNLAVFYGIGLIVLAGVMGYIYNLVCTHMENKREKEASHDL